MRISQLAVWVFLLIAASAQSQMVVEDWKVHPGNAAATGNGWITLPNRGHGIDFISGAAPANLYTQDVVVLLTGEGPTDAIRALNAETGQHLSSITMSGTGDSFRDHTRIATSDDGYIYVAGFEGTVQEYTLFGSPPNTIVSKSVYSALSSPVTGGCRVLEVTGSKNSGTLKIFVAKQNTIVVFGNTPASPTTFSYLGRINTTLIGDIMVLTERNGRVYTTSVPSGQVQMFEVTYQPFSVTGPALLDELNSLVTVGADMNETGDIIAFTVAQTSFDEVLVANVDLAGTGLTNIPAYSTWDKNSNGRYDGGTVTFKGSGGTTDVCMDPESGDVYAYFPHHDPVPPAAVGAVMKLSISAASAGEWMMY